MLLLCQRLSKDNPVKVLGSKEVKGHRLAGAVCTKELPAAICAEELPAEAADQGRLQGGSDHGEQLLK